MDKHKINLLVDVGLNNFEATIYLTLLQNPNITGYRIAKILGKALPNTYKALDSLKKKGAIIADKASKSQQYTAVPIGEYLDRLQSKFEAQRSEIEEALKDLETTSSDEGIFRLDDIDQVYAKAISMIRDVEDIVLVDASLVPLEKIREQLEEIAADGKKVIIQGPDVDIKGCEVIPVHPKVLGADYIWLNLIVDGSQYLLSLLEKNEEYVFESIWSRNSYLSLDTHFTYINEFIVTKIESILQNGGNSEEIGEEILRLKTHYINDSIVKEKVKALLKKS